MEDFWIWKSNICQYEGINLNAYKIVSGRGQSYLIVSIQTRVDKGERVRARPEGVDEEPARSHCINTDE